MKRFGNQLCAVLAQLVALAAVASPVYAAALPVTGDDRPIGIIIGVMAVALVAVLVLAVMSARGSNKKKR